MQGKKHTTFEITTKIFNAANNNIDGETENDNVKGLDTNKDRHDGLSNQELALIVNTALIKSERNWLKKNHQKELANMKKAFDATSAFTMGDFKMVPFGTLYPGCNLTIT